MKKMMIMASTIMMVVAGNAKNVEIKPFESVDVNVPACIRFVSGDSYEMGIRSTDSIAAENIQWFVEDGILKIRSRYEQVDAPEETNVCITIVSPREPKLTVGRNYEVQKRYGMRSLATAK